MNMLVIGNGFDLALGLPTKYTDFLDFAQAFLDVVNFDVTNDKFKKLHKAIEGRWKVEKYDNIGDRKKEDIENNVKKVFAKNKLAFENISDDVIEDLNLCIKNNLWFQYFWEIRKNNLIAGENWIDIEHEIQRVIYVFEERILPSLTKYRNIGIKEHIYPTYFYSSYPIKNFIFPNQTGEKNNNFDSFNKFVLYKQELVDNFNKFVLAFEIYLDYFIHHINQDRLLPSDLENYLQLNNVSIKYVLSFNYIDNFSKSYNTVASPHSITDYIHGNVKYISNTKTLSKHSSKERINHLIHNNNMVLGFDEHLDAKRKNELLDFVHYRKYFQRIYKGTGCNYLDWLDEYKSNPSNDVMIDNPPNNVYIYGHSLDSTDKDVFEKIFSREDTRITIFYHNLEAKDRIIVNLIRMLSKDFMIANTAGSNSKITFISQSDYL